jgi:hypothetical protein
VRLERCHRAEHQLVHLDAGVYRDEAKQTFTRIGINDLPESGVRYH